MNETLEHGWVKQADSDRDTPPASWRKVLQLVGALGVDFPRAFALQEPGVAVVGALCIGVCLGWLIKRR